LTTVIAFRIEGKHRYTNENQSIDVAQPHPRWGLAAEDDHLLTQDDIFSFEVRP
jgi:hypothetical protein